MKKVPGTFRGSGNVPGFCLSGWGGNRLLSESVDESVCSTHEFILAVFGICSCAMVSVKLSLPRAIIRSGFNDVTSLTVLADCWGGAARCSVYLRHVSITQYGFIFWSSSSMILWSSAWSFWLMRTRASIFSVRLSGTLGGRSIGV